jgi:hypothetical protein
MQSRRLVRCGLVDANTFRVEASDGEVWLHRVERDEQGSPVMEQIHRWLNLIWAPPAMDEVLLAGLGSNQGAVVIPGTGNRG